MLEPLQQDRLEALLTALIGVPRKSERSHATELINFLEQNYEIEAVAFAVAKASCHQKAFGETSGTKELLSWAKEHLSCADFEQAMNFFLGR